MSTHFNFGDRVLIAKQKATVRYVGAVDGNDGIWVGVEWDDPGRGKHDGSTGGKRYFSCLSSSPTAASFVRVNKVAAGSSLVDALVLRYTNKLAEGQQAADGQAFICTSGNRKVWVELVGEDKVTARQSRLDLLLSARLVAANVSHVGPAGQLAAAVPNLQQLDLTDNLIGHWETISSACQELPQLRLVNLSLNRLQLPASFSGWQQQQQQLTGLQCLVLNQCGITWQQVGVLQSLLPQLQELHVSGNNISSLHLQLDEAEQQQQLQQQATSSSLCGFLNLQVLGLEDNCLSNWAEVMRLAGLPQLRRLQLSGNPICSITYPQQPISPAALWAAEPPSPTGTPAQQHQAQRDPAQAITAAGAAGRAGGGGEQPARGFGVLQALLLGNCRLDSWRDVDQLNAFPALHELRLSGNPLFASEGAAAGAGRRYEVIGRVGGLTLLNGADVKPRERRDCELRYLQTVMSEAAAAAATPQQQQQQQPGDTAAEQHPRLAELQAKYGQVGAVGAVNASQQGSSLRASTVEVLLGHGPITAKKKLPRSITIAALRLLTGRLFKLPPDQQQLVLHGPGCDPAAGSLQGGEVISADDTKSLAYWDVEDGALVEVCHVDLQQQRSAAQAALQEQNRQHEQRMEAQLQQGDAVRQVGRETVVATALPTQLPGSW